MLLLRGTYTATLRDRSGRVISRTRGANSVVTVGQNLVLASTLTSTGYTTNGPFMGLIGALGSGISVNDTMTSKSWTEAASYGAARGLANNWGVPSGGLIALTAGLVFTASGTDTINGAFLVTGTGATNGSGNTAGTLLSAGSFAPQSWVGGQTLTVGYQLSASVVPTSGGGFDTVQLGRTADGLALTYQFTEVTSVASGASVMLDPAASVGDHRKIHNRGANILTVNPPSGAAINQQAVNASVTVPINWTAYFEMASATQWYSIP